jgi:hypothetical protein
MSSLSRNLRRWRQSGFLGSALLLCGIRFFFLSPLHALALTVPIEEAWKTSRHIVSICI